MFGLHVIGYRGSIVKVLVETTINSLLMPCYLLYEIYVIFVCPVHKFKLIEFQISQYRSHLNLYEAI